MRQGEGQSYFLPAPTNGLSKKVPLPTVPENMALKLVNLIPDVTLKKRPGTEAIYVAATTPTLVDGVESLVPLHNADGTYQLFMSGTVAGVKRLYELVVTDGSIVDVDGVTITHCRFQHIQFGGRLLICNGYDRVLYYNSGGPFFQATGFTIGGAPDDNLINVGEYNERLYFVLKDSTKGYYGGVQAVSGALTEYDFQTLFTKGGHLVWWGGLTNSVGDRNEELSVAISSEGEVRTFSGSYPGHSTWSKAGHYFIGRPMAGNRCTFHRGGALHVITEEGVISMASVLGDPRFRDTGSYSMLTDSIQKAFTNDARLYGGQFAWMGIDIPRHNLMLVNVPISTTESRQYVMSTLSGAWCEFQQLHAMSWCILGGLAYFGTKQGVVLRFGEVQNDWQLPLETPVDNGYYIPISGETAFSPCDMPNEKKGFLLIRPIIYVSGDTQMSIGINTDFQRDAVLTPVTLEGTDTEWDSADWDTDDWADGQVAILDWRSVEGNGFFVNIAFEANLVNTDFELLGFLIQFRPGGIH